MVKVYGFFGVRLSSLAVLIPKPDNLSKDEQLYISDPRALHSIISKDQDAFEETAVFIE
jgi:hypothetical protein